MLKIKISFLTFIPFSLRPTDIAYTPLSQTANKIGAEAESSALFYYNIYNLFFPHQNLHFKAEKFFIKLIFFPQRWTAAVRTDSILRIIKADHCAS